MKRIGIIGAGQAGQRIAVALSTFEDVEVTAVVDPKNGREILSAPDSKWNIRGVTFYSEDPAMLANQYDGIIVASDPINTAGVKPEILKTSGFSAPLLWERPFGHAASHPNRILQTVPSTDNSVMSFARYGLPARVLSQCVNNNNLGEIIDFEVFITLNCGLKDKEWRHNGTVTQPIHLLDTAFELIESMGIGKIHAVSSKRQDATRAGISYDEKWTVSVELDSGVTGRIIGIQYLGDSEFLYSLRQIRIVGSEGAFVSSLGNTYVISADGSVTKKTLAEYPMDDRVQKAADRLEDFFKSVDGYHESAQCKGEAIALAECLRAWVDHLHGQAGVLECSNPGASDSKTYLQIGEAVLASAESGTAQSPSRE